MVAISTSNRIETYEPVNSTGPFPISFPVFDGDGADLLVLLDDQEVSGWTYTGTLESGFYGEPNTWVDGSVSFASPITGELFIKGLRSPRRQQQFAEGRGVPARDHNTSYNTLTAVDQEARRDIDRAVSVPDGELGFRLPRLTARKGRFVGFDATTGAPIFPLLDTAGGTMVSVDNLIDASSDGRALIKLAQAGMLAFIGAAPAIHNHEELYLNSGERFGMSVSRTDNDVPINTAILDIADRKGGELILPANASPFGIESTLLLADSVSIAGQSAAASVIQIPQTTAPGGGLSSHPIVIDKKNGVRLRDFSLVGNRAAHGGAVPSTQFNGIYAIGASDLLIEGVQVRQIENDGIVLAMDAVIGGANNTTVRHVRVSNTKNGILCFKGGVGVRILGNWVDNVDLVGILNDDATAADTTSATAVPNIGVTIAKNLITNYSKAGSGTGILVTGALNFGVEGNFLRVGGVVGVDAGSSKSASGIVVNSGENRHDAAIGGSVVGNVVDTVAGGGGITLQGAHGVSVVGNALRGLFVWPTSLSGSAINLLEDTTGNSPQKSTTGCYVGGNAIEGTANTAYALQLGPGVNGNQIDVNATSSLASGLYDVSSTAGSGQILHKSYGVLPTWTAGMRGWTFQSSTNDVTYFATATRWKPLSIPNESLPSWTAAQEGDVRYAGGKLYVGTSATWVVVGTQT